MNKKNLKKTVIAASETANPGDGTINNSSEPPLILAIETSGRFGSVALAQGAKLVDEIEFSAPLKHSTELFPSVNTLLAKFKKTPDQIRQIHISVGPGSFTGLRIAATFAKTMNLAFSFIKIVAVSTLDVIAANIINVTADKENTACESASLLKQQRQKIAVVLDAKRNQFFIAAYECKKNKWVKTLDDCLITAPEFIEKCAGSEVPVWLLGEGLVYYKDKFKAPGIEFLEKRYWYPKASKVHQEGWKLALEDKFSDPITLSPVYLRKAIVSEKRKQ